MSAPLSGRVAIVTGAAGGIGGAIAKAFKEAGAQVACVDLAVDKIGRDYLPIARSIATKPCAQAGELPMPTECSQGELDMGRSGSRKIVGAFDGGAITSNGWVVLLAGADRTMPRSPLLRRYVAPPVQPGGTGLRPRRWRSTAPCRHHRR